MNIATLSKKYQSSIVKKIRNQTGFTAEQQFVFISKRSIEQGKGILPQANIKKCRDRKDSF